jgi:nicotinate phosphoribosyltransferase
MGTASNTGSLALLTDLYQLTMAYGYWKRNCAENNAVFHLFFRRLPFQSGYAIAAGAGPVGDLLESFRFTDSDLQFLAQLTGNDGEPLFEPAFLDYLRDLRLTCDVDAIAEGTLVFQNEPLLRVRGPILQAQILETVLLNVINFQTLIATKASRICSSAQGEPVLEFGLRRAQGIDGALAASRAAFIGGCSATSNVLAGKLYGIPVRGTHAHSWVMSFDDEPTAFSEYAAAMPNNCVFLVDTYDTLQGVHHAIEVGKQLAANGHRMAGIRLDSGDLAYLSIEARKLLDAAGFEDAVIVASNDLDEHLIESLKHQGAKISVWGVGTKLVTAYDQPALGGVYKLGAVQDDDGTWQPRMKISEQMIKSSIPGVLQVRRFEENGRIVADAIYDEHAGLDSRATIVDPNDPLRTRPLPKDARLLPKDAVGATDLLQPLMRDGALVGESDSLTTSQQRAADQLAQLHPTIRRLVNPHTFPVGLDVGLHEKRWAMMQSRQQL